MLLWCLWNARYGKSLDHGSRKGHRSSALLLAAPDHPAPVRLARPRAVRLLAALDLCLGFAGLGTGPASRCSQGAVKLASWRGADRARDHLARSRLHRSRSVLVPAPLHRLREVVPGRIYISAMPTYWGLELAQERHHFKTIINLYPEHTSTGSPLLPDELRFAKEHGIAYVGHPPDDPSGEAFVAQTSSLLVTRPPGRFSFIATPAWTGRPPGSAFIGS